jgi:AraC-like DNA-binding protein
VLSADVFFAYTYSMMNTNENRSDEWRRSRLAELIEALTLQDGEHRTPVEGVLLWRASAPIPRHPVVYRPRIVVVAQGCKRGYLGGQMYCYDPYQYLVLAVPLPFECETQAMPDEPLLAAAVDIDTTMLGEMLLEMDEDAPRVSVPRGIYSSPLTADLSDAVIRLMECLASPLDSRVLGRQLVREILYRVLRGEQGDALRALANRNDHFTQIARVLRFIHTDYAQPLTTNALARRAGMSVSVFHQNFKLVTETSPIQYIKQVRLHRARTLMAYDGHNAGTAANEVGYESQSQFGREFKRLFGVTPAQDAANLRSQLAAGAMQA